MVSTAMQSVIKSENPNKSLEGIKTERDPQTPEPGALVKTLINPWKGLKRF